MSGHTPGPWRVDPNAWLDVQTGDGRLEIACTSDAVLVGGVKPDRESQRANARLIAAAPELLEALQKLLGAASWSAAHSEPFSTDSPGIVWARAAIAKATGAES